MGSILVHWDEPRPFTIYYESKPDKEKGREVSIPVKLIPGVQTIDEGEWEKIKNHKRVKQALETDKLKIEMSVRKEGEKPQPLPDMPKNLKGMIPKDAIHFISGVMDEALLKKYRAGETREPVKKAITVQLDKLKAAIKKSEE